MMPSRRTIVKVIHITVLNALEMEQSDEKVADKRLEE
jgi:hypothetical protein